jgi:curli production assembly/transport component CsgG
MNLLKLKDFLIFIFCVVSTQNIYSQENEIKKHQTSLRAKNVVSIAVGTSVINGDFVDPLFEIYSHIGYKRFLAKHININFSYNKFNLAYKDILNEGFMSFDLNLEYLVLPNKEFSPFIFVGGGLNASNYFKQTTSKTQVGIGLEYLISESIGVKVFSDYNYVFSDELDGLIAGESDDTFFRIALGLNFYFGRNDNKRLIKKGEKTIITSNPIDDDY